MGNMTIVPTLVELQTDPSTLDRLPLGALLALRRQLRVLAADPEREVTARLLDEFHGDGGLDAVAVLTPARLAQLWSMPTAKIRELCRTGRIPARAEPRKMNGTRPRRAAQTS